MITEGNIQAARWPLPATHKGSRRSANPFQCWPHSGFERGSLEIKDEHINTTWHLAPTSVLPAGAGWWVTVSYKSMSLLFSGILPFLCRMCRAAINMFFFLYDSSLSNSLKNKDFLPPHKCTTCAISLTVNFLQVLFRSLPLLLCTEQNW